MISYSRFSHPFLILLPLLGGCTHQEKHQQHPGLSEDGYGFVANGPRLPPPPHLLQKPSPVHEGHNGWKPDIIQRR